MRLSKEDSDHLNSADAREPLVKSLVMALAEGTRIESNALEDLIDDAGVGFATAFKATIPGSKPAREEFWRAAKTARANGRLAYIWLP